MYLYQIFCVKRKSNILAVKKKKGTATVHRLLKNIPIIEYMLSGDKDCQSML